MAALLVVEFALLLAIADTFDETVQLYTNALLGNAAAANELYYRTMINSLFRAAGMILAPVLEPIGGMIAKSKLVQKIGGAVDDVVWEGNNKILATSEKYRNLVLAGFDEGDVGGLFSNPNCFLYADDVIAEALKSGNAKGVMDSLADCGDDVIRAINDSSNKGAVVEQVSKFGDDIVNAINESANKEAAVALISEFGDDGAQIVMRYGDEAIEAVSGSTNKNVVVNFIDSYGYDAVKFMKKKKTATGSDELKVRDISYLKDPTNNQSVDWEKFAPNYGRVVGSDEQGIIIEKGTFIDRYGPPDGGHVSPYGVPYEDRALPYHKNDNAYHVYYVNEDIEVERSVIAPAFNYKGGGIQYKLDYSVEEMIAQEKILEVK